MSRSAVNDQILDSIATVNTLVTGQAPASAQAIVDLAAAQALGTLLHGAVQRHQQSATSGAAAATAACARILAARSPILRGAPPAPADVIAEATAEAEEAIEVLQSYAVSLGDEGAVARAALSTLQAQAAPPQPTPASPPPASDSTDAKTPARGAKEG